MEYMLFFFLLSYLQIINSLSLSSNLCHNSEMAALLEFKQGFSLDQQVSFDPFAHPKMTSWKPEREKSKDCCTWDGVECHKNTGHIIGLDLGSSFLYGSINSSSSLFKLVHLRKLSLADNHFNYSQIPSEISRLSNLSFLNLSSSFFWGQIPVELLSLSKLTVLDLADNTDKDHNSNEALLKLETPSLRTLVQNLTNLEILYLRTVHINNTVPEILGNSSALRILSLEYCNLYGEFPQTIFHLPKLEILWLVSNENLTGYLPEFHQGSRLKDLELYQTSFSGIIPDSIGKLSSLVVLDLEECNLVGTVPASICNLTQLTHLSLTTNKFNSWTFLPCLGKLHGLTYLSLGETNLHGDFPSALSNLTKLTELDLSFNHLTGQIPSWIMNLTRLTSIDLSDNVFQGPIPSSFSQLKNLDFIALHYNKLSGLVESKTFFSLPKLVQLILEGNNLTLLTPAITNTTSLQKFKVLALGSCNIKEFPGFLRFQDELEVLSLEKNMLCGQIPEWLTVGLPWDGLAFIDLSSNMLEGSAPNPPPSSYYYKVSNNNFTGEIPHHICHVSSLGVIDLSNNELSGKIPPCLGNFSNYLSILNLRGNNFQGTIPQIYSKESKLRMLDLSQNRLEGRIPRSIGNCKMLQALILGNNQMKDTFPFWLGGLSDLQVLILRSNKFHGSMVGKKQSSLRNSVQEFPKLRIIDVSDNGFTGNLPQKYFQKWAMMQIANVNWAEYLQLSITYDVLGMTWIGGYEYTMNMMYKGVKTEYEKIPSIFTAVDLSSNKFSGNIPLSVGRLKGLQLLNLSNNHLSGFIPQILGSLEKLESLDLSQNQLSGEIPNVLSQLTFLAFLNVSNNHLVGVIPKGNQFDTFQNTSYINNSALCGYPLSKQCGDPPHHLRNATNDEGEVEGDDNYQFPGGAVGWMVVFIGYGSGLVVGLIFGRYLVTRNHEWFVEKFAPRRSKTGRRRRRRTRRT